MRPKQLAATLFLAVLCCTGIAEANAGSDLAAKVGNVPITRAELERESQKILPMQVGSHGGVDEQKIRAVREQALNRLIERALLVQHALQEKLKVNKKEIQAVYQDVEKKFASAEEFKNALEKETPEAFRASIARELLAQKAYDQEITEKIRMTEADLRAYYETHRGTFLRPKKFRASLIQIRVDPQADRKEQEAARAKAADLAAKARAGEDFYNLAYFNSDDRTRYVGGDIGYFHEGRLIGELQDPLLKLQPGEIAGPIRSDFGYNIIKLTELEEARQLPFEEVRDNLRRQLEGEKRQTLYQALMTSLQQKYPVQRFATAGGG